MKSKKPDKLKLRATLREKRHYLVLKILSEKELNNKEIKNIIDKSILNFIGTLGYACAGPMFIKIIEKNKVDKGICQERSNKQNPKNKNINDIDTYFVLLSISTKYVDYVKAASALTKEPQIKCVGVSGTIKKAQRFLK
jgi:RNase P/RNase MRP subunit POP5